MANENSGNNKNNGINVPQTGNVIPRYTGKPGFTANTRPGTETTPPPQNPVDVPSPEVLEPAKPATIWDKFKNFMNTRLDTPEGKASAKRQLNDFKSKLMWLLAGGGFLAIALWKAKPFLKRVVNACTTGIIHPIRTLSTGSPVEKLITAFVTPPIWVAGGAAKKVFFDLPRHAFHKWGILGVSILGAAGLLGYKALLDHNAGRDSKLDSVLGNAVSLYHKGWNVAGEGAAQIQNCTNQGENCAQGVTEGASHAALSGVVTGLSFVEPVTSKWWNYIAKPFWGTEAGILKAVFTDKTMNDVVNDLQGYYTGKLSEQEAGSKSEGTATGKAKTAASPGALSNKNPDNTYAVLCQYREFDLQPKLGKNFNSVTSRYWKAMERDFDALKRPDSELMRALQSGKHLTIIMPKITEFNEASADNKPKIRIEEFKSKREIKCHIPNNELFTYNKEAPAVTVTQLQKNMIEGNMYPWQTELHSRMK